MDTINEARKILVEQLTGTLVTIAKDLKIQVEFNPAPVGAWRLLGYENRVLRHEDFNDDTKDGGDIGAGHTVTAFYEIVPVEQIGGYAAVDPLNQQQGRLSGAAMSRELLTVKLRYKDPEGAASRLLEFPLEDDGRVFLQASQDFQFAAAVAAFGMLLRESPYRGEISLDGIAQIAGQNLGPDPLGYRAEFLKIVLGAVPWVAAGGRTSSAGVGAAR